MLTEGYYIAKMIKPVPGYEADKGYKVVVKPTFKSNTGKLGGGGKMCIYKSVIEKRDTGDAVVFPDHMGYKSFESEEVLLSHFELTPLAT